MKSKPKELKVKITRPMTFYTSYISTNCLSNLSLNEKKYIKEERDKLILPIQLCKYCSKSHRASTCSKIKKVTSEILILLIKNK